MHAYWCIWSCVQKVETRDCIYGMALYRTRTKSLFIVHLIELVYCMQHVKHAALSCRAQAAVVQLLMSQGCR
jgi:hypothetical protein